MKSPRIEKIELSKAKHEIKEIFDPFSMCIGLGVNYRLAWYYATNSRSASVYNEFFIDKYTKEIVPYEQGRMERGHRKLRYICAPAKGLKIIQSRIAQHILRKLPMHECNYAYMSGRGIAAAAERHVDDAVLVRIDLKDFFPNHSFPFIAKSLEQLTGLNKETCWFMTKLCTRRGEMPQGAVTSPMLSIVLNYDLDKKIADWAAEHGFTYTRYADDLFLGSKTDMNQAELWNLIYNDFSKLVHPHIINFDKVAIMRNKKTSYVCGVKFKTLKELPDNIMGLSPVKKGSYVIVKSKRPFVANEYEGLVNHIKGVVTDSFDFKPVRQFNCEIMRMLGLHLTAGVMYPRAKYNKLRLEAYNITKEVEAFRDKFESADSKDRLAGKFGLEFIQEATTESAMHNLGLEEALTELMAKYRRVRGKISYVKSVDKKRGEILEGIIGRRSA